MRKRDTMDEKRIRWHCLIVMLFVLTWTLVACRGPTPTPTAQLATATPTTVAIRAPIRTPTPTTEGVLELREALAQGLVEAQVRGNGSSSGDSIIVELTRKVPRSLELTIPAGTVLRSKDSAAQNMVVLGVRGIPIGGGKFRPVSTMRLTSDAPQEFLLEAYCLDFDRENPSGDTGFSVGELASPQVQAVFEALGKVPAAQRAIGAIQTAIWVVTDDVCERELQARFQVGAADLEAAQDILEAAGVDPATTCLFGQGSAELPQGKKALPTASPVPTDSGVPPKTSLAVAEGVRLYLRDNQLSTEPPPANASARFECYGSCSFTWPMTLTVALKAQSYGYRLDVNRRFHLKLTLTHEGRETVLVEASRLSAGSPTQGTLGGQPLDGIPGDVLTLELSLPDGGTVVAHEGGGGLMGDLFGGGGGSASFITLSQAEPPPSPTPTPIVGARLPPTRGTSSGPAIAIGPDDTLHIAWSDQSEGSPAIFYARSTDGGVSFSLPIVVAGGLDVEARGAPTIAGGPNGAVAIAWEEKRGGVWGIAFSHSADGENFGVPTLVGDPDATGDREQPTLAAGPEGTLYLAWRDLRVGESGGIFFNRATAEGGFDPETPVSPFPEFQGDPVLAVDGQGRVHLAWTDRRDGPRTIYYARADDSVTFAAVRTVSEEGSHIPSLAVDKDGGLHLAWAWPIAYVYHTHYAVSTDGGHTFSPEDMLNDGGPSVSVSPPNTAVGVSTEGTVYVAFRTSSPRDGVVIHYDRRKDGRFGRDVTVAGGKEVSAPSRPAMASDSQGRIFLAWGEHEGGSFQVYLARAEAGGDFSPKGRVVGGETGIVPGSGETEVVRSLAGLPPKVRHLATWQYTTPDPHIHGADGIAVDGAGNVYVTDWNNAQVQKFTSDGRFLLKWGSRGLSVGQFGWLGPDDIAVDGSNNVYVLGGDRKRVQKFSSDGRFLLTWGSKSNGDGQFGYPGGIAVDGAGNVYVTDQTNHRVQKFTSEGRFLLKWGSEGNGDGQFSSPGGIAVDGVGNVYVADRGNNRVQKFSSEGRFLLKWGSEGSGDGQFRSVGGIAVDRAGNVYVVDDEIGRVQKFTPEGRFLLKWGSHGEGDGQFNDPWGIAVDGTDDVYVSDTSNGRIQKFAVEDMP